MNKIAGTLLPILAASMLVGPAASSAAPFPPLLHQAPVVKADAVRPLAPGVSIIPDPRINYVPNIGVIEGSKAILVVDTGLGPENGKRVYALATQIAQGRRIYLTTTHFHPEHSFGASAFPAEGFILNQAQADELAEKGPGYLDLFRSFGTIERNALQGTCFIKPAIVYQGRYELDLGGRSVTLLEAPAHTRGDQLVYDAQSGVVFAGDLIEERFFPIMPDSDTRGSRWIEVADQILALSPRIVVPGHGEVGNADLVRTTRAYLQQVREAVWARVDLGQTQEQVTQALLPALKALHPNWDNSVFIPYEIAVFHAERTGAPTRLPDLSADLQSDPGSTP